MTIYALCRITGSNLILQRIHYKDFIYLFVRTDMNLWMLELEREREKVEWEGREQNDERKVGGNQGWDGSLRIFSSHETFSCPRGPSHCSCSESVANLLSSAPEESGIRSIIDSETPFSKPGHSVARSGEKHFPSQKLAPVFFKPFSDSSLLSMLLIWKLDSNIFAYFLLVCRKKFQAFFRKLQSS